MLVDVEVDLVLFVFFLLFFLFLFVEVDVDVDVEVACDAGAAAASGFASVAAGVVAPDAAGVVVPGAAVPSFVRASGNLSRAVGSVTGAAVTSVIPDCAAADGTVAGIVAFGLVMVGDPDFAAIDVSGLFSKGPNTRCIMPGLVRFSCSNFMRATAAGSASGTGISSDCNFFLASSAYGLSG